MTTRTVTGTIFNPKDDGPWNNAEVVFKLRTPHATAANGSVMQRQVTALTDLNGDFSVDLAVPDVDAWQWQANLPDGNVFTFNLEAGASINLHTLQADNNLGATVSPSDITPLIAGKADKVSPATAGALTQMDAGGNLESAGLLTANVFDKTADFASAAEAAGLTVNNKALTPDTFGDALGGVDGELIRVDIDGLVGDGVTDDTTALQTILTANQGTNDIILRFSPNKTYLLDTVTWSGAGSLIIEAHGAILLLANSATNEHIFDVTNPTRAHFFGGTYQGASASQGTGVADALIEVTTGANTESIICKGIRFEDIGSRAINTTNSVSGGAGSRFTLIEDIELQDVAINGGGDPVAIRARGNQENVFFNNIRSYDSGLADAGKVLAWSADVLNTSDKIGNVVVNNVVMQNSGTAIFGQSYRSAAISNVVARDIGTSSGGTDYNVNFIKIDDAGVDAQTSIFNSIGRHSNVTYSPAIRFEETDGLLDKVTQNIQMTNVYCDGDIVATASGGHKLIRCETTEDFAISADCELMLCKGGTSFNVNGANNLLSSCTSPLLTFAATSNGSSAQGGRFAGVTFNDGAEKVRVNGAYIKTTGGGNSCINISGDHQSVTNCIVDHSGGISIDIEKVGAIGIRVLGNLLEQVSTGSTVPIIRMNDPLEVFIENNHSTGGGSRRIRRTNETQLLRGRIANNVGFQDGFVGLPGTTVGDLVIENNPHWSGGTLTYLPSYHPTAYTITNDITDRTFDADTVTLTELADVVATLIRDMERD